MSEPAPGALLGHYKIVRRLGQGGMGVVYEAVDQKLGRHVAIKLLVEAGRDRSSSIERFWREARAASSLNHPGICTIHELNETAESPFIVMELLEGSSLEKLYRRQPMPYPRLVELGVQLADALDAAHRKGILHRDIKPANIFLTNSGQAKLLDFGLAKLEDSDDPLVTSDPYAATAIEPLTNAGASVGTVAYMSPEQARAEPLDARSDLFSLGVVLYEMATGQHPFAGASTAVVYDRILNHPPVAPILPDSQLPAELAVILNKTLEKDRNLRCQSAAELRADLRRLQRKDSSTSTPSPLLSTPSDSQFEAASGGQIPSPDLPSSPLGSLAGSVGLANSHSAPPANRRSRLPAMIAACIVALSVLAVTGIALWRLWPRTQPFATISVNQVTNVGTIERIALSADGRFLAEVKNDNGARTLWIRNTATNTDTQILSAFANEYAGLAFSPDGNYLYFTRGTPENVVLSALYVMPVFGGTPRRLVVDVDTAVSLAPDGNRLTYVRWTPDRKDQQSEVHIADKDGGADRIVYATAQDIGPPVWSSDGERLAWLGTPLTSSPLPGTSSTGTVGPNQGYVLQIFDLASKKLTTIPAPAGISFQSSPSGYTNLVWLPNSRHLLAFYLKPHTDHAQIGIVAASSGEFRTLTNDVNAYSQLALSADGRTLATVLTNVDSSIAYYNPEGGAALSITPLRISPSRIAWSRDDRLLYSVRRIAIGSIDRASGVVQSFDTGEVDLADFISSCPDGHILFTGFPKGSAEARVFRMDADGGNIVQLTISGIARNPGCSADGREVYYSVDENGDAASLWAVPLAGGTPRRILAAESTSAFEISPDGKLAGCDLVVARGARWKVFELPSGRTLSDVPLDASDVGFARFSPDNRGVVHSVLQTGGRTLLYQPLDGSAPHSLLDPVQETIRDFAWSQSGKQLAAVRGKSSSDVVLIVDSQGNQQGANPQAKGKN